MYKNTNLCIPLAVVSFNNELLLLFYILFYMCISINKQLQVLHLSTLKTPVLTTVFEMLT